MGFDKAPNGRSVSIKGITPDHIALLASVEADKIPHGSTNLMVHLLGVATLLDDWGLPSDTVLAGLFHATYGSESYEGLSLPISRDTLRSSIGRRSEQLVYLYCAATPTSVEHAIRFKNSMWLWNRFDEKPIQIDDQGFQSLMWLYFANAIEKDARSLATVGCVEDELLVYVPVWKNLAGFLGDKAISVWQAVYGTLQTNEENKEGNLE